MLNAAGVRGSLTLHQQPTNHQVMGHNRRLKPLCNICGDIYSPKRARAGYHICMPCGEQAAAQQRKSWTVLTLHKQGPMFFTAEYARTAAVGANNKGGIVK